MMNINKQDVRIFFRYVLPSIFSFALSGIYSIVDGYFIGNRLGGCGAFCCDDRLPYRGVYPGGGDWTGYGRRNLFLHRACKRTRQRSKQVNRHSKLADARIQRALNDPCSVLQRPYAKTFGRKWEYVTSGAGVHYHHFIRNGFADFRHRSRPIHP